LSIKERWAEIQDFPHYLVSQIGRVAVAETSQMLRPYVVTGGYHNVKLNNHMYFAKSIGIHRLVFASFHGVDLEGLEVRHVDGQMHNNALWNLDVYRKSRGLGVEVRCVETGEFYASLKKAGEAFGVSHAAISAVIKYPTRTVRGCHFELL
jgi:hypothetical protein